MDTTATRRADRDGVRLRTAPACAIVPSMRGGNPEGAAGRRTLSGTSLHGRPPPQHLHAAIPDANGA